MVPPDDVVPVAPPSGGSRAGFLTGVLLTDEQAPAAVVPPAEVAVQAAGDT